jgi:hypothetical protein
VDHRVETIVNKYLSDENRKVGKDTVLIIAQMCYEEGYKQRKIAEEEEKFEDLHGPMYL